MRRTIFDDTHEQFRSAVRSFLEREAMPHNDRWEREGIVDRALFEAAGASGFLGIEVPEKYGGGGVRDFRFNMVLHEEIQRAGHQRRRARADAAQRHLPAVLPEPHGRRPEAALAARDLLG